MVQKNVALAVAALAIGAGSSAAAPLSQDGMRSMVTRDSEAALYGRADRIIRAGTKVAEAVLTNKMKEKVNEYTKVSTPVPAGLVDAAKKATGPHDPALVRAATHPKPPKKKGRSLDFDLEERDFFDEEELYARADKIVRAGVKVADAVLTDKMKNKVKEYTKVPTPVPAGLVDAAKKATGPHDPALVRAATNPKPPKKKGRSLDFDLEERDFQEELYARADKIVRAGVKVADAVLTDKMKNKVKEYTKVPTPVPAGLVDAAKKAAGPHDPALVRAATNPKPPKKARSLDFDLEERDFFEEELYARADNEDILEARWWLELEELD